VNIDFNAICKDYGVRPVSYRAASQVIRDHNLEQLASSTTGFCLFVGEQPVIFYDDSRPAIEIHFTVAHELGHIMLGHLNFRHEFFEKLPDCAEREADAFAVQLLANELVRRYEGKVAAHG